MSKESMTEKSKEQIEAEQKAVRDEYLASRKRYYAGEDLLGKLTRGTEKEQTAALTDSGKYLTKIHDDFGITLSGNGIEERKADLSVSEAILKTQAANGLEANANAILADNSDNVKKNLESLIDSSEFVQKSGFAKANGDLLREYASYRENEHLSEEEGKYLQEKTQQEVSLKYLGDKFESDVVKKLKAKKAYSPALVSQLKKVEFEKNLPKLAEDEKFKKVYAEEVQKRIKSESEKKAKSAKEKFDKYCADKKVTVAGAMRKHLAEMAKSYKTRDDAIGVIDHVYGIGQ
jgi:hypothetical protein